MIENKITNIKLTSTERGIADYILSHRYEVANYTIGELADITYSSNASIIRLCKKLGYSGYKSFMIDFIKETEIIKSTMKNVNYDYPFEDGTPNEILRSLGSLYKEASDLMIHSLDVSQIEKVVKLLSKSRRIFMIASGDTLATTNAFINRLVKLDLFPIVLKDETQYVLPNISQEDVVVFVSYGLKSKQYESYYEILSQRKIPIITISANVTHSIAKNATCLVTIPQKEGDFKVSTFYSQFMFEYIFNFIYSRIYVLKVQSKSSI